MTLNRRMVPATMLALGLMGLHAGSQASTLTTQTGSDCKSYGWSSSGKAFTGQHSIENGDGTAVTPLRVVCPLTRVGPGTSGGLRVWIDGWAPSGTEVTCVLWSLNYNGLLLASQSFNVAGAGSDAPFDRYLELAPDSVPAYSSQVVTCDLPKLGAILDIEPISL